MTPTISTSSDYLELYHYLPVMDGEQIRKLRRIATGVMDISTFTDEEIAVLDTKLEISSFSPSSPRN